MLNSIIFAAAEGTKPQGNVLVQLGPMIIIFGVMIFFMIWTQKKQARQRQQMLDAVKRGSKVVTAGGIYGEILEVKEKTFIVSIADKVNVEINKGGVSTVIPEAEASK